MADPTKKRLITPHEIEQCEKMAGLGMTLKQMGHIIGVSKPTLDRRMHDQPELADALERGRAKASAAVRSTAFKMATSGKHAVMTIFWLKCRDQWREASADSHHTLRGRADRRVAGHTQLRSHRWRPGRGDFSSAGIARISADQT